MLEKLLEPLYSGTPAAIAESLPALMSTIKMMLTIARCYNSPCTPAVSRLDLPCISPRPPLRYYNSPDRMATLFAKLTNQMVARRPPTRSTPTPCTSP